ncbi:hypothetical protein NHU_00418 [Rhodovulum sulfidophilum]|uniref:Uncharacterized protein n=1 Tax=Rhodovulum sulfidophilum TaxID=35806 RepID=A0A0D6AXE2_RHOSU|nr:hypothetical protein NHU_00418 [Rhodovulum sulfidophilum]
MAGTLTEQLSKGAAGKAILFCGAGASLDSLNFNVSELPAANPLLGKFNEHLGKSYSRLPIAASKVADKSINEYFKIITECFSVRSVSEDLRTISGFPWKKIYTTNYDDSLEQACTRIGKSFQTLTAADRPTDIVGGRLPLVHLHGFVNSFRIDTIREECILDFSSNVANAVYEGPWGTELKNDIATSDVIVFLGYSLYDPEVSKLILKGNISKSKIFFVNSRMADEELEYMQEQFGTPVGIEKDGFAKIVGSIPTPSSSTEKRYVCFRSSRDFTPKYRAVNYQDLNDLFIFGRVQDDLIQSDVIRAESAYSIIPSSVSEVLKAIDSGKGVISLYSPLGHGKTLLTKILAAELGKNHDVFLAIRNQDEFLLEITYIVKRFKKPIIIIDDYYKYVRYQGDLARFKSEEVTFIFTSRLGVFESRKEELPEVFLNHDIQDIRIGRLKFSDAEQLVPLINQAGMWGELSQLADGKKAEALLGKGKDGFQANFADILVGLMNSSEMIGRIRKELSILKELSGAAYEVVLLSIYMEFTNNHIDEFVIDQALGANLNEIRSRKEVENIFRIFFSPGEEVGGYFSGSLFAKYAMERICDANDLLEAIEIAANRYAEIRYISQEAKLILIDLLRFNYLKVIAAGDRKRLLRIRDLYSNLSANKNLNRDDLFWNAFGMCERQLANYEEAVRHFRTGISYSKVRNERYISYHAQNQLIVCLLERGLSKDIDETEAAKNVIEIADLLIVQADDERMYGRGQAFKWHQELLDFLEKYFPKFSQPEKAQAVMKLTKYLKFVRDNVVGWQNREHAGMMVGKLQGFLKSNIPTT